MRKIFASNAFLLLIAVFLPLTVAWDIAPIVGVVQQQLAVGLWGFVLLLQGLSYSKARSAEKWPTILLGLLIALAFLGLLQSQRLSGSPDNGLLSAAMLLAIAAIFWSSSRLGPNMLEMGTVLFLALLAAGLFNALVCLIQVLAPQAANDVWIASGSLPGRGNGNLRQPNHLAALMLWAIVGLTALVGLQRISLRLAVPLMFFLVLAIVLSGSRLGLLGCGILVLWSALDARLSRVQRHLLWSLLGCLVLAWLLASLYAHWQADNLLINQRLLAWAGKSTRGQLWSEVFELIFQNPLTGVGWGEFNFAWTLSPKNAGQVHYFGNAHNLPLQLAVELGLPLMLAICTGALWIFWRAGRDTMCAKGDVGIVKRAAFLMLLLTVVHSLLEYPLWYAVFALPAAMMMGLLASEGSEIGPNKPATAEGSRSRSTGIMLAGLLMIFAAGFAVNDYKKIATLAREKPSLAPLIKLHNLSQARSSLLYSWVAFRATARNMPGDPLAAQAARYAAHGAVDVDLMIAWAEALNIGGQRDKASYLAQRIAEFNLPTAQRFMAACTKPDGPDIPFQCAAPKGSYTFEDFR